MSENTKIWDILGRTDPTHTKAFTRGGGFRGTAIKPIWSYRRMTEEFGPVGYGWGVNAPTFQVVNGTDGEVLVYCTVSVWFKHGDTVSETIYGVGGDKVVTKFSSGLKSDDEAFKKAFTDAVTNALKLIGVGADVHMGMFDDNKYVNTMRQEFADTPAEKPASSASLKKPDENGQDAWKRIMTSFDNDMIDVQTLVALESLKAQYRAKVTADKWPAAWKAALKDRFDAEEQRIIDAMEKDDFPGDIRTNRYAQNVGAG